MLDDKFKIWSSQDILEFQQVHKMFTLWIRRFVSIQILYFKAECHVLSISQPGVIKGHQWGHRKLS